MVSEREVLQIKCINGDIEYYEISPLQKRILFELPLLNGDELVNEIERVEKLLLNKSEAVQKEIVKTLPFTTSLTERLNVSRSNLVNAISRKNGYRKSLMELGIVNKVTFNILRYPTNFYYKMYEESIIVQDISDDQINSSREYKTRGYSDWRKNILNRDKVCQCCGFDKHLQVHHLFGYEEYPEIAVDNGNGVVLCKFCHEKYHSIYGLKNINPLDYIKFINRFGLL